VHGFTLASDALARASRRQKIALQLQRREGRTVRDVVAAPDRGAGVRKRDDRGCEEKPGPGDEVLGHVDVANDQVLGGMIEDATQLTRHERAKELGHDAGDVTRIRRSGRLIAGTVVVTLRSLSGAATRAPIARSARRGAADLARLPGEGRGYNQGCFRKCRRLRGRRLHEPIRDRHGRDRVDARERELHDRVGAKGAARGVGTTRGIRCSLTRHRAAVETRLPNPERTRREAAGLGDLAEDEPVVSQVCRHIKGDRGRIALRIKAEGFIEDAERGCTRRFIGASNMNNEYGTRGRRALDNLVHHDVIDGRDLRGSLSRSRDEETQEHDAEERSTSRHPTHARTFRVATSSVVSVPKLANRLAHNARSGALTRRAGAATRGSCGPRARAALRSPDTPGHQLGAPVPLLREATAGCRADRRPASGRADWRMSAARASGAATCRSRLLRIRLLLIQSSGRVGAR